MGPPTIDGTVTALCFFFTVTLDRADTVKPLTFVAEARKFRGPESGRGGVFSGGSPRTKYKAALAGRGCRPVMLQLYAALAEKERRLISERTRLALAQRKPIPLTQGSRAQAAPILRPR